MSFLDFLKITDDKVNSEKNKKGDTYREIADASEMEDEKDKEV